MIDKTWSLKIQTPFGVEDYTMVFKQIFPSVSGRIFSHKGEMVFDNGQIIEDVIKINSEMEYPVSCNVKLVGKIKDETINGYFYIDEYLKVSFEGKIAQ